METVHAAFNYGLRVASASGDVARHAKVENWQRLRGVRVLCFPIPLPIPFAIPFPFHVLLGEEIGAKGRAQEG